MDFERHGRCDAGAGHAGRAAEAERIRQRAVVFHREVLHLVPGLTLVEVDLDGARRSPDRPEQSVRGEARIVVDELVRVRRKGST